MEEADTSHDQIVVIRQALDYLEAEADKEAMSWEEVMDVQNAYNILKEYSND